MNRPVAVLRLTHRPDAVFLTWLRPVTAPRREALPVFLANLITSSWPFGAPGGAGPRRRLRWPPTVGQVHCLCQCCKHVTEVDILGGVWEKADVDLFYREFGQRVRVARKKANLSQEALGRAVGLTRTSVTNIEKGRQHVPLHMAFVLAEAMKSHPDDLLPDLNALDQQRSLAQLLEGVRPDQQEWMRRVVAREATAEEGQT
jgi:transcriptional regulator with XRE-family HTH domain